MCLEGRFESLVYWRCEFVPRPDPMLKRFGRWLWFRREIVFSVGFALFAIFLIFMLEVTQYHDMMDVRQLEGSTNEFDNTNRR